MLRPLKPGDAYRNALNAQIADITDQPRSSQVTWLRVFNEASVPCGLINTIDQTFADPQVKHLGIAHPVEHPILGPINLLGQAVTLSDTPFKIHNGSPEAGQHTAEILNEFGITSEKIAHLREQGII